MKSLFKFYEVVKLRSSAGISQELIGREGVILGISSDENGKWYYAVDIEGVENCRSCEENDLESTGKFKQRGDFYSEDSVRVSVDPQTGEGKITPSSGENEYS